MDAEQAMAIASQKKPSIIEKEYESIMEDIKSNANKGKFDMWLDKFPSIEVQNRLKEEGFWFYTIGGTFEVPFIFYGISWKKKEANKNIDWGKCFGWAILVIVSIFIIISLIIK